MTDLLSQYPKLRPGDDVEKATARFVYFVQVGEVGPIKIGIAANVEQRVLNLQTANYQDVRLLGIIPGDAKTERAWQVRFDHHNLSGEWYAPHPDVLAGIDKACGHYKGHPPKSDPLVIEIARKLVLSRALDGRWHQCLELAQEIVGRVRT